MVNQEAVNIIEECGAELLANDVLGFLHLFALSLQFGVMVFTNFLLLVLEDLRRLELLVLEHFGVGSHEHIK